MKLITIIRKFLGFKSKAGRPRISQSKQDAIKTAPKDVTDADLARLFNLSCTTIQRYRYGKPRRKIRSDSQGTP
jgi:predicted signal transduction protein with EAL and GGDEF domain